ncbi:hypothetical protein AAEX28_14410 [Lentisphaerota bacterium WC36G]|nr:hypothetical protein LJT99_01165 [Lentisphaerae bacterium WC36]
MVDKKIKKQIDQEITNTLLDDFDKFEHMLMKNWKLLFGSGVMIVLTIGVTLIVMKSIRDEKAKESAALVNCLKADEKTKSIDVNKVLETLKKYPKSKTVYTTKFALAANYLASKEGKSEDNIQKALAVYSEIADDANAPKILVGLALNRQAAILESQNKNKEALEVYKKLVNTEGIPSDFKSMACYNAGSVALNKAVNDKAFALDMFKKVIELSSKNSMRGQVAQSMIADIDFEEQASPQKAVAEVSKAANQEAVDSKKTTK